MHPVYMYNITVTQELDNLFIIRGMGGCSAYA